MGTRAEGGMAFVEIESVQWQAVLASRGAVPATDNKKGELVCA